MSGFCHPYLESRNGIWTLRVRVPPDVQLRVGLREFRRSLRTDSPRKARQLAAQHVARLKELFEMARDQELTDDQIASVARRTYAALDARVPRPPRDCEVPEFWRIEQIGLAEEQIASLREQAKGRWFERAATESMLSALGGLGLRPNDLTTDSLDDAYDAVLKAHVESLHRYVHRLETPLVDYQPSDPLLRAAEPVVFEPKAVSAPPGYVGAQPYVVAADGQVYVGASATSEVVLRECQGKESAAFRVW